MPQIGSKKYHERLEHYKGNLLLIAGDFLWCKICKSAEVRFGTVYLAERLPVQVEGSSI